MSELDLAPFKFAYNAVVTADDKQRVLVGAFPLLVGEIERLRALTNLERFDDQWVILDGEHNTSPVGPFMSEAEAHAEYKRNQPSGQEYLRAPTVVRLLRPAFGRFVFAQPPISPLMSSEEPCS